MRRALATVGLVISTWGVGLVAQPDTALGTWSGPARCQHAGGETFTMVIDRDADGRLRGTMDWARSSSDGRRGPGVPFTTVAVEGNRLRATTTVGARTIRLDAVLDGERVSGSWASDGDDDRWTFEGTRTP